MEQQNVYGSLASGGTFRATPDVLEIRTPTGEVAASFETRTFSAVNRAGSQLSIHRPSDATINVTAATLQEAESLERALRSSLAPPPVMPVVAPYDPAAAATMPPPHDPANVPPPAYDPAAAAAMPPPYDPTAGGEPPAGDDSGSSKMLKWGCIGALAIVGIMALCLIVLIVFFRDTITGDDDPTVTPTATAVAAVPTATATTEPTQTPEPTATNTPEPTATSVPEATATQTPEPEATATPEPDATATAEPEPTATPEPEPELAESSRESPVPFGELAVLEDWRLQVHEVVRGQEATDRVIDANVFNDPPWPGHEYVLINMTARYTGDEESADIDNLWFRTTGDSHVLHSFIFIVDPSPAFRATLAPGEEVTGWMTAIVRENETNLILVFEEWLAFDQEPMAYLALEPGASVTPIQGPLATPDDQGLDRNDPIPFGERAVVDEVWEIWMVEWVRGQEALDMVMEANQFNDPPDEGMEYVAVRIGARNIGVVDYIEWIDSFSFRSTGDAGEVYSRPFVVRPEPALDFEMFTGGEAQGWVILTVAEGEQNILVVYESWIDFFGPERYFALE